MTNTQKAEADKIAAEELECISEILNKTVPKTAALPMCQDFGGGIIGGFLQGQQAKEGCTPAGPGYADRDSHAAVAEQLERLREQMQLWQGQQFVLQSQQNFWDMVGAMNGR